MLLCIVLLSVFIQGSYQVCDTPYPYQVIDVRNPKIIIIPPVDDFFQPCAGSYVSYAYSGNETLALGNIEMQSLPDDNTDGTLTLKNADGSIIYTVQTQADALKYAKVSSKTANISISWSQNTNKIYSFSGSLVQTVNLGGPTKPPTTAIPSFTTEFYNGSGIRDPKLISHDLFIGIDAGLKPSKDFYSEMKNFASAFAMNLSIITGVWSDVSTSYTRVSMLQLTPLDEYATNGGLWELDSSQVSIILTGMLTYTAQPANYVKTLKAAAKNAFSIRDVDPTVDPGDIEYTQASRPHAQRTFIIFTNQLDTDFDQLKLPCTNDGKASTVCDAFLEKDIRLIIVGYKPDPIASGQYANSNNWFSYFETTSNDMTEVTRLLNEVFLDGYGLCKRRYFDEFVINDDDKKMAIFYEPTVYKGPMINNTDNQWKDLTGQRSRYCNFQQNTYVIRNQIDNPPVVNNPMCLTIFYDLEVERDFLRVYEMDSADNRKEIASFTGIDVIGSMIQTTKNLTLVFETNHAEVYGGFYVYADNDACPTRIPVPI